MNHCQGEKCEPLSEAVTSRSSKTGSGLLTVNSGEVFEKVGGPERELVDSGVVGRVIIPEITEYSPEKKNSESLQRSEEKESYVVDYESDDSGRMDVRSSILDIDPPQFIHTFECGDTLIPYDVLNDNESTSDEDELYPNDEEELDNAMKTGRYWYVVRDIICKHQRLGNKCPCMFAFKIGKNKYYYDEKSLNDLMAINMECRLNIIANTQNRDNIARYRFHKLVIIALTTKDARLVCDPKMPRGVFLKAIYELREHYQIFSDFGQRNQITEPEFNGQGFGDKIVGILNEIGKTVWDFVSKGAKTMADLVTKALSSILGC